jgi:uncharacterized membrane protein
MKDVKADVGAARDARRVWAAVVAISLLGGALRTNGLAFGLPAVYNPDETAILSRSLAFATGDLNPHNFLYPTLFFYVLFAWIGGFFVAGRAAGVFESLQAFQTQFFVDPTSIHLAGRSLGVVAGVATIVCVFVLGRRLFGAPAGLIAALLVAVAPAAVRDAHYIKHDVPATLAIVAAMLAIARLWPGSSSLTGDGPRGGLTARDAAIAGAASGLACAVHYYAVFIAAPLLLALRFRMRSAQDRQFLRHLAAAGAAAAAVFLVGSPFLLVEPATAWRDITANRAIDVDRAVAQGGAFETATA